jgi:hypothetical protein
MRLQDGGSTIMHNQNHRGGPTFLGDPTYDAGGTREPERKAAALSRTDGAEQSSRSQGSYGFRREYAVTVNRFSVGGDARPAYPLERRFVGFCGRGHFSSRSAGQLTRST